MTSITEDCPYKKCDGTGLIWIKDHQEKREFMRKCQCKEIRALSRKMKWARIPEDFQKVTIKSFDINLYSEQLSKEKAVMAKKIAANFVKKFDVLSQQGKGLYFYSSVKGSGKTRLGCSILNALLQVHDTEENPLSVFYSPTADLIGEIKNTFGGDTNMKSSDIIDAAKNVKVLLLDDIGVEKASDWVEETLTRILDYRLQNKKVTLFTSNLEIDELDNSYPAGRISDRIDKMTFPVHMPEEKIRRKLAKQENESLLGLLLE
ncbi:ATP-binding protein [Pseudobacillus sp. 179-B 2D1 NHS]|uniref:ATP-binding protein n=1 Tax=Pseudobacillus sp. 179-B 2D1 NHS TaxID=3374292 RepID=UPI003879EAD8